MHNRNDTNSIKHKHTLTYGYMVPQSRREEISPSTRTQAAVLCLQYVTETDSIHGISRDSRWQQFCSTHILINAIHWHQRHCSAIHWSEWDGKRPNEKADLAIYIHILGVSG